MHRETYSSLDESPFRHRFLGRIPNVDVQGTKEEVMQRLRPFHNQEVASLGGDPERWVTAEQVHGDRIHVVETSDDIFEHPGVDGLISDVPGMILGIAVADCCAVYLLDPVNQAFALLHSGKKGSELGITSSAISKMQKRYGTDPKNLTVQLSPCIRPPAYEIDFAAMIRDQCAESGIPKSQIHDDGRCTGSNLDDYYSYRIEKGVTGRMMALGGFIHGQT